MAMQWCLAARRARDYQRNERRADPDRFSHPMGAPAFHWRSKESGPQALGFSRARLGRKLHLAVDTTGKPLRMIVKGGQVDDVACVKRFVGHLRTRVDIV